MNTLPSPSFEGYPVPTITGEGPVTFEPVVERPLTDEYDVYRVRPHKYPWAGFHDYTSVIGGESKNEKRRAATDWLHEPRRRAHELPPGDVHG